MALDLSGVTRPRLHACSGCDSRHPDSTGAGAGQRRRSRGVGGSSARRGSHEGEWSGMRLDRYHNVVDIPL